MASDQTDLPGVGTRLTLPRSAGFRRENEPGAGFRLDAGEGCALATLPSALPRGRPA